MMKALKAGLFGLALGALGAVAVPTQEAEAQGCSLMGGCGSPTCCSSCNPYYQRCLTNAGNNTSTISFCVQFRSQCESLCTRSC